VRVIDHLHPLFGQVLLAKAFVHRGGILFLIVTLPDGSPATISADATDALGHSDAPKESPTVLSIEGIRKLKALVETTGSIGNSTTRSKKCK
jgi:hypothetical protein